MKKNVLLVEYDSPTIENIKDILSSSVFEISIASEGDVAKKLIKKKKFDLLICAAMLPKFHGFELSKFSKETNPDSKVIVISGVYKGTEYRNKAISEYQADEFIEKPFNDTTFFNSVLNLLEITKDDVEGKTDPGTTQIPVFDTKKIKTPSGDFIKNQNKLSSKDIFGDLIDNVENIPEHKIELDKEDLTSDKGMSNSVKKEADKKAQITQILSREAFEKTSGKNSIRKINDEKINIDLKDIIKTDTGKKDKKAEKKIEEDIMKKFEETLSGLGIKDHNVIKKESVEKTVEPEVIKKDKKPQKNYKPEKENKDQKKNEIEGYEILGLIARGGMAEIYKAKKRGVQGFEKILAIKKILSGYGDDDKYIEMFVDEAKIASELSHPNIVQIYDFGQKDNYYFIAMEYVEGKDLRLILRKLSEKKTKLEEYISIYISLKILDALSYAHSAKDKYGNNLEIVHRDISPPNILLSYTGEVKITDFGVSKASNKLHQTLSGALKGKLLYMSPEQAKADKNIDKRSDIYSVGAILFELLTGQKLFKGSSEIEVLKKVQDGKITLPSEFIPDIDPDLERIILKSLEINKSKRYSNAAEMSKDLEAYLYKNFNHIPTPIHINVCLYDLFKDEILKDGIRVNLSQIPFEITRITTKEEIEHPVKDLKKSREINLVSSDNPPEPPNIINLPTEDDGDEEVLPESIDVKSEQNEPEKYPSDTPDEKDVTESTIDLSYDNKKVNEYNSSKNSISQIPESLNIEKFKKKRVVRPILVLLFIIIAVAAGIYFLSNSFNNDNSDSVDLNPPEVKKFVVDKKDDKLTDSNGLPNSSNPDINSSGQTLDSTLNTDKNMGIIPPQTTDNLTGESDNKSVIKDKNQNEMTPEEKLKEEKKKQDAIKKKKELEKKRRLALDKKKREAEAERIRLQEEARKKKEEDDRLQKIEDEKKRLQEEADKRKRDEEARKKLIAEQNRAKPGQIVSLGEVDKKPVAISTPAPVLPRSIRAGSRSNILVSFLINEMGSIEKVKLIRKSEKNSVNSIIKRTILKWKYSPAIKDGVKVKVWRTIPLNIK